MAAAASAPARRRASPPSPTSSTSSSAISAAAAAAPAASAAPTFATISKSRWRRPSPARRWRSRCRRASPATPAQARAPSPARTPKACPTCGGAGRVRASQGGFFHIERTCPACHGRGEVVTDPCPKCSGAGRVSETRTLSVNIPAGIEDGTRIRLAGEGEAGRARRPGRRPLHLPVDQAARLLPARRRRHLLPRAGVDDDGRARRAVRGADARRRRARA